MPDPPDGAASTATITPATDAAPQRSTLTAVIRSPKNMTDTGRATTGARAAMINAVAMLTD